MYDFDNNGQFWVQRGEDIDGENTDDLSGYVVSISADGSTNRNERFILSLEIAMKVLALFFGKLKDGSITTASSVIASSLVVSSFVVSSLLVSSLLVSSLVGGGWFVNCRLVEDVLTFFLDGD